MKTRFFSSGVRRNGALSAVFGFALSSGSVAAMNSTYLRVSFDRLGDFQVKARYDGGFIPRTEEARNMRVPDHVLRFSNQKLAIADFMVPLGVPDATISTFILVRDRSQCCFGGPPKISHSVLVTMAEGRRAEFFPDSVVEARGTFRVLQTSIDEETAILYEMIADEVDKLS